MSKATCKYCYERIEKSGGGLWVKAGDGTLERSVCQSPDSPNFRHAPGE